MSKEMLSYKNGIRVKIKELEAVSNRLKRSIGTVKNNKSSSSNDLVIDNYTQKLEAINDQLAEQKEDLRKIEAGDVSSFDEHVEQIKQLTLTRNLEEKASNKLVALKAKHRQKKKDATYQKCRKENRSNRWDKKKYKIYYSKFCRAVDSVPDYMKENLKKMPNNKGYLWRGITVLGEMKPVKDEPLMLFEKRYGVLTIHKYFKVTKTIDGEEMFLWKYEKHIKKREGPPKIEEIKYMKRTNWSEPPGAKPIEYASPSSQNNRRGGNRRDTRGGRRDNSRGNRRDNSRGGNRRDNSRGGGRSNHKKRSLSGW
jgi:hypothetical protein